MENIFVEFLPPWVETGLQPAFYDKESGTVLQQTARMYARVNMLIRMFNKLSKNTKEEVERFEEVVDTRVTNFENSVNETVADYIEQFNQLHDYVHDYFDNLDVQEEINNKLDEMVEQGTLQEIVAEYLNSKAVFGFDNVADMKSATNFIDGSYAETLGYYSKNDGGKATYKIRKMTNDDVIDEKFIIEISGDPTNELVAELVISNPLNVLQIGCTENNLPNTIAYVLDKGIQDIYVPAKNFTITEPIVIDEHRTKITIDGNITSENNIVAIKVLSYFNVINFNGKYTGNGKNTFMQLADDTHSSNYNTIYINEVINTGVGIQFTPNNRHACAYNNITFCDLRVYETGILIQCGDSGTNYVNENNFFGGRIECNNATGIKFVKGSEQTDYYNGNSFYHIAIDENVYRAIDCNYASYNNFRDLRISEGLTGETIIYFDANSKGNYVNNKSNMLLSKIKSDCTDANTTNVIESPTAFVDEDGFFVCKRVKIFKDKMIGEDSVNPSRSTISAYNTATFSTPSFYYKNMVVNIGADGNATIDFVLPDVFNRRYINDFHLRVSYHAWNANYNLKDSDNNTIISASDFGNTSYSNKYFHIYYRYNQWIVEEE
jgi:hypothetical protein